MLFFHIKSSFLYFFKAREQQVHEQDLHRQKGQIFEGPHGEHSEKCLAVQKFKPKAVKEDIKQNIDHEFADDKSFDADLFFI